MANIGYLHSMGDILTGFCRFNLCRGCCPIKLQNSSLSLNRLTVKDYGMNRYNYTDFFIIIYDRSQDLPAFNKVTFCTSCDEDRRFFSSRRDKIGFGSHVGFINIKSGV